MNMTNQMAGSKLEKEIVAAQIQLTKDIVGAWKSQIILTLNSLGIFEALRNECASIEMLSQRCNCSAESLGRLCNAAVATGYLRKQDNQFSITPEYVQIVCSGYESSMVNWLNIYSWWYKSFADLGEAVRLNKAVDNINDQTDIRYHTAFINGMLDYARYRGSDIMRHLDLSEKRNLLDVGCGPGVYASMFAKAYPDLTVCCYDVAATLKTTRKYLAENGLTDRIDFKEGDYHTDSSFGGSYEVIFMSHVLHQESDEECRKLILKAHEGLVPGGMLVVQAMFLNNDREGPLYSSLHDLLTLLIFPKGRNHTFGDISGMMTGVGFSKITEKRMSLFNVNSLVVAEKG